MIHLVRLVLNVFNNRFRLIKGAFCRTMYPPILGIDALQVLQEENASLTFFWVPSATDQGFRQTLNELVNDT